MHFESVSVGSRLVKGQAPPNRTRRSVDSPTVRATLSGPARERTPEAIDALEWPLGEAGRQDNVETTNVGDSKIAPVKDKNLANEIARAEDEVITSYQRSCERSLDRRG
ncbi:hypothetical protein LNKW23_17750 [Paralimibaculum aggregatum]|uniref:Uncharacterized protein n=1 Tax=Paralimibaculum aggregatum TaxID=3036245 RepID=A0ABQ6LGZ3_9RHOB|nr:hypothetical protein LNKW23_17750 [Limibaculum sp. NKW23]